MWVGLLVCVPLLIWWGRRSLAGLPGFRSIAALVVRCLVVAALAAALARAQLVLIREDMAVAFVVDTSLSVPTEAREASMNTIASWLSDDTTRRQPGDRIALVTFGRNAAIDQPFTTEALNTAATAAIIDPDHTDVAAAIRTAVAAMPQAGRKRIVLFTDGNENAGAALAEAAGAKSAGVRIDCLPIRYSYTREVMIEKVSVPPEAQVGKTVAINALVRAFEETRGILRIFANGIQIAAEEVDLKPGVNAFSLERELPGAGFYDFKAQIECRDDKLYQNNQATAFTIVGGEGKVLIIEGRPEDGNDLAAALSASKLSVETVHAESVPLTAMLLTAYDVIILANVAAFDLPAETIKTLGTAVKDYGVGLIMVGGDNSFGAGGWKGTAVEEALPVTMDVKDQQVVPSGALVVIMHTCEFADGNRWGITIGKAAVDTLGQYDEFGLLYYGAGEEWLIPLAPVTDRAKIKATIDKLQAGDMPSFDQTLTMAEAALVKSTSAVKHIVIISDGDPSPPTPQFLQRLATEKISVSTIAVFPHDGFSTDTMQAIAKYTGGKFYQPTNPRQLPQIMIKEARTVRRGLIMEKPFIPQMVMPSTPVTGFKNGDFPPMKGYVLSTVKPLAEMPLVTPTADPLMAHWQYGIGRSAAFTSDAKPKWASEWMGWTEFRRFWGQMVEWAQRNVQKSEFSTSTRVSGEKATVAIDAVDRKGEFVNFVNFTGSVLAPDGTSQPVRFDQTGPGHYEATFKADQVGTYIPVVRYTDATGNARTTTTAVSVPFSPEYRALATNDLLLKEIADVTGGQVVAADANVFRRDFPPGATYTDVWQWAMGAGALLFLVDVFLRRVIIEWAKVWARVRVWIVRPVYWIMGKRLPAAKVAYTSALLTVKKRAREARHEAAQKFTAAGGAPEQSIAELEREQALTRSRARAEKVEASAAPPREVAREKEETFTSKLLEAKRKAVKERKQAK